MYNLRVGGVIIPFRVVLVRAMTVERLRMTLLRTDGCHMRSLNIMKSRSVLTSPQWEACAQSGKSLKVRTTSSKSFELSSNHLKIMQQTKSVNRIGTA